MIVAIDGPAGAGKSSVARALAAAARLPLPRHRRDVPRAHLARAAAAASRSTTCRPSPRSRASTRSSSATAGGVCIAGHDVTAAIRDAGDRLVVPVVARHQEVREVMRERQRAARRAGRLRDRGPRHRRRRRAARRAQGLARTPTPRCGRERRHAERDGIEVEALADEMRRRDERDAANTHRADDAVEVDTTDLELDRSIDRIEALVQERGRVSSDGDRQGLGRRSADDRHRRARSRARTEGLRQGARAADGRPRDRRATTSRWVDPPALGWALPADDLLHGQDRGAPRARPRHS